MQPILFILSILQGHRVLYIRRTGRKVLIKFESVPPVLRRKPVISFDGCDLIALIDCQEGLETRDFSKLQRPGLSLKDPYTDSEGIISLSLISEGALVGFLKLRPQDCEYAMHDR